jgi:alpha-1,2-mannosyltransferase
MTPARHATLKRFSIGLLLFWIVTAFAINGFIKIAAPEKYRDTVLDHTAQVLRGEGSDDSWGPMQDALNHLKVKPRVPIYSEVFFNKGSRFQYPPSSLFVLQAMELSGENNVRTNEDMPESPYPFVNDIIGWLFIAMSFAATAALLETGLAARFGEEARSYRALRIVTVACLTLTFYPIVKAYTLGQIQVWINGILALALLLWALGRKTGSGMLIGAVCLLKPHYGLFVAWAALRGEWRFLFACVILASAGLAAAVAVFGVANHLDYLRVLSFLSERGEVFYPNHSVNGLLNRLMALKAPQDYVILEFENGKFAPYAPAVYWGTVVSSAIILGAALLHRRTNSGSGRLLDFATMGLSLTIASPIAWEHHYGLLLPIFALLAARLCRSASLASLACVYALAATYIQAAQLLAQTPFNPLQSYLLFAGLAVLVALHVSKASQPLFDQRRGDQRPAGGISRKKSAAVSDGSQPKPVRA